MMGILFSALKLTLLIFSVGLVTRLDQTNAVQTIRGRASSYWERYHGSEIEEMPVEEKLFNFIFNRYNLEIRPVIQPSESVAVDITFSLMQINSLDEKTQVFRTYGWLVVEWKDERLMWKPEDFGNMTEFIVDSGRLWTPELALINAVEYQFPDFSKYRAILRFNGTIRWEPAGVFETSCKIDISFYPYDKQVCDLVFGTWTYTSQKVNLTNSTSEVITDDYNTSGEWEIVGTTMQTEVFTYQCCPDLSFSKVSATISLKRKHRFYTMNLVLPCAMLSSLTLVTFLSPPDQGEKISLGISILLSFSVFMLALSENMPKTSDGLPLFGIFTTYVMLMNTTSVMLTVFVLNLHHRHDNKPVPRWVRNFVFKGLARILCMSKDKNADQFMRTGTSFRGGYSRKRSRDPRDHFTIAYAAEQFSGKLPRNAHNKTMNTYSTQYQRGKSTNSDGAGTGNTYSRDATLYPRDSSITKHNTDSASTGLEDKSNECHDALIQDTIIEHNSLDDWRELARIMDRLFFWFTLLAMVFFCASIFIASS